MTIALTPQMNNLENANFKLSLAQGASKSNYLASGVDYYIPQNAQADAPDKSNSKSGSVLYFVASAIGLITLCAFMPEIRMKLSDLKAFKDFDNLHKIEKSDKFLGKLKLGFMKTVDTVADKVMSIRTSFNARKM